MAVEKTRLISGNVVSSDPVSVGCAGMVEVLMIVLFRVTVVVDLGSSWETRLVEIDADVVELGMGDSEGIVEVNTIVLIAVTVVVEIGCSAGSGRLVVGETEAVEVEVDVDVTELDVSGSGCTVSVGSDGAGIVTVSTIVSICVTVVVEAGPSMGPGGGVIAADVDDADIEAVGDEGNGLVL